MAVVLLILADLPALPAHAAVTTFPFLTSAVLTPPSIGPDYSITSLNVDPSGTVWVTESHPPPPCNSEARDTDPGCVYDGHFKGRVARLNADNTFTEFELPQLFSNPSGIVSTSDGNLWFMDFQDPYVASAAPTIDRMSPSGQLDVFQTPPPPINHEEFGAYPGDLTVGPDGNLYFLAQYGGNLASNGLLAKVTLDGAVTWIPLQQWNQVYGNVKIVSAGGVLWFTSTQYDNCSTCYPAHGSTNINYYAPTSNTLGGYSVSSDVFIGRPLAAGPGGDSVWAFGADASVPGGVARIDRAGRLTIQAAPVTGSGMVAGADNRAYMAGSSGCGGVSRVDWLDQVDEAMVGTYFAPQALDPSGAIWGIVSPGCSSSLTTSGIQSLRNLDVNGPSPPPQGAPSAAFTATQRPDPTGNANVVIDLNACATTGDLGGFNWTIGSEPIVPFSFCDYRPLVPVGDVSVTLDVSGVPGGPSLSSLTQTVHTTPHAVFTHAVDKTHTGAPDVRVSLNACQSSGVATFQYSVQDQDYFTPLTAVGNPGTCLPWYVDVLPLHRYAVTLTVTAPASANSTQDSMTLTVDENMVPDFKFSLDQVSHSVSSTTLHVDACNSIGVGDYQWTVTGQGASSYFRWTTSDIHCKADLDNIPLHVVPSDTGSAYAYYSLQLTARNDLAYASPSIKFSMAAALAPPPTFEGCQWFSLGPDSCAGILAGDVWSSFGAKRPPDFLAFNVGAGLVSGGIILACDGSAYLTAGLNTPSFRKIDKIKDAIESVIGPAAAGSFAYGWVGNPQDASPTNAQIDDFVGAPGEVGYQIGGAVPFYGVYFLSGSVFGQPQFGLLEVHGFVPDLSISAGAAVPLAGPLIPGSACVDGALVALQKVRQNGGLGPLLPYGTPQTSVNMSTATSPLSVAPGQTVGVTASGFTPATQFGASIHSQPITLGIGTTDANGNVSFGFTVPSGLSPGSHRLVVTGWSQGQPRELSITLILASRTLAGTGTAVNAREGAPFSGQVASFTDTSKTDAAVDFTASISWGDGTTSAGTVSGPTGGPFTVTGAHTYGEEVSATINSTLTHTSSGLSALAQGTAAVADPSVTATGGFNLSSLEAADTGVQTVATFTDQAGPEPNAADPSGVHYTSDIKWGDGSTSPGVIAGPNASGVFAVAGSHTYAEEGTYQVQTTIHHEGAADVSTTSVEVVRPRNGEIVYSRASTASGTDHHAHIWVVNPDGSNAHAMTTGTSDEAQPVWSPDGTRVAFTSTRNGLTHIFVMNADGSGVAALTTGAALDLDPAWSPDGTKIAFTSSRGGRTHIYVVSANGGTPTALSSGSFFDATPAWSPDGLRIAFTSTRTGNTHIFVMNAADGTGVTALTTGAFYDSTPAWSPDGAAIAFTSSRGGNTHIYAMKSTGATVTALTSGTAFDTLPSWSADGTRLAFTSTRGGQVHIYVMNADGSTVAALTSGPAVDASPSWRAAE